MHILWVIIIGFVAGLIARLLAPGYSSARRSGGTGPIRAPD